jgi:hypothetical protein
MVKLSQTGSYFSGIGRGTFHHQRGTRVSEEVKSSFHHAAPNNFIIY